MKTIALTGGKGGTGKSTVAVLLAKGFLKKGKRVLLCDCDVECPNDYLLINQKLKKPVKKIYAYFPVLDKKKCQKCGLCRETCQSNAIFQKPGSFPVFIKDLCSACGACWQVCPFKAIKPKKEEVGKVYLNTISKLWLVTGMAKPGLEETGPVVSQVKEWTLDLARKVKADYVLFDTAAGIHCPVISALMDCNLAYLVTEPTPMGIHDLKLVLDLCRKLKVPAEIIINQSDLGDKKEIKKIAQKFKIKIKKEIPYSKEIVQAYSQGNLLKINEKI